MAVDLGLQKIWMINWLFIKNKRMSPLARVWSVNSYESSLLISCSEIGKVKWCDILKYCRGQQWHWLRWHSSISYKDRSWSASIGDGIIDPAALQWCMADLNLLLLSQERNWSTPEHW